MEIVKKPHAANLVRWAEDKPNVFVLSADLTSSVEADLFRDTYPDRFLSMGIAEQNMLAFAGGTAAGVILGKIMCRLSGWKINPLIGSAGVSAVPMAARVSQVVGQKANPSNFLLMHAMGPNVAGVIGTAVAAGTMLAMLGAK